MDVEAVLRSIRRTVEVFVSMSSQLMMMQDCDPTPSLDGEEASSSCSQLRSEISQFAVSGALSSDVETQVNWRKLNTAMAS